MKRLVAAVVLLGLLGGCASGSSTSTDTTVAPTSPTAAPAVPTSGCVARGLLPDPNCTPGATNPAVTQATIGSTICVKGWTATVRPPLSVTNPIKVAVEGHYGISPPHPHPFSAEELDHLIPLELGGAPADVRNLWPEAAPGYHAKDLIENRLKAEVCSRRITLVAAQHEIAADWQHAP